MQIKLTSSEKAILTVLLKTKSWLNVTQISKLSGVSWNTTDKYIAKMNRLGWLSKNGNYWRAKR